MLRFANTVTYFNEQIWSNAHSALTPACNSRRYFGKSVTFCIQYGRRLRIFLNCLFFCGDRWGASVLSPAGCHCSCDYDGKHNPANKLMAPDVFPEPQDISWQEILRYVWHLVTWSHLSLPTTMSNRILTKLSLLNSPRMIREKCLQMIHRGGRLWMIISSTNR